MSLVYSLNGLNCHRVMNCDAPMLIYELCIEFYELKQRKLSNYFLFCVHFIYLFIPIEDRIMITRRCTEY